MRKLVRLLEPFDVFFVGVHCPLAGSYSDERLRAETERSATRSGDYESIHRFALYDVEVDSAEPLEENVELVTRRVEAAWAAECV